MKKIITIVLVLIVVAVAAMFLKEQKKVVANLPLPELYNYNVSVVKPTTKKVSQTRHFLAQLLASKSALIASKFSAKIKKIYIHENDIVKKGELLIALDDRETKANIDTLVKQKGALIIDLENAKRSLDRNKNLLDIEAISQEKYDDANVLYHNKLTNLTATKEKIRQAEAQLSYLQIKAPFSGRVGGILIDEGNLALPGRAIISLNSDDQKLLFSYVSTAEPILEGEKVLIDSKEIGTISKRYDDAKNALLVAEVKIDKPLTYANKSFLNIDVVTAETTGCSVPLNSLLHNENRTSVMEYKENSFHRLQVNVILEDKQDAILQECPTNPIATASEAKLAILPSLGKIKISKEL